jgi:hypothetical protein
MILKESFMLLAIEALMTTIIATVIVCAVNYFISGNIDSKQMIKSAALFAVLMFASSLAYEKYFRK